MTEIQKQNIMALRGRGLSFGQIASQLGLSVNTVKSFCRRAGASAIHASNDSGNEANKESKNQDSICICKHCGKPLQQLPKAKPKQYCGDTCRAAWWNAQRGHINRAGMVMQSCAGCGVMFASYPSTHRKFCGHACFTHHRRAQEGA